MGAVLSIQKSKVSKSSSGELFSIADVVLDPEVRQQMYDYYDSRYEETDEKREIYDLWKERRERDK